MDQIRDRTYLQIVGFSFAIPQLFRDKRLWGCILVRSASLVAPASPIEKLMGRLCQLPLWLTPGGRVPAWAGSQPPDSAAAVVDLYHRTFLGGSINPTLGTVDFDPEDPKVWERLASATLSELRSGVNIELEKAMTWLQSGVHREDSRPRKVAPRSTTPPRRLARWTTSTLYIHVPHEKTRVPQKHWHRPGKASRRRRPWMEKKTIPVTPAPACFRRRTKDNDASETRIAPPVPSTHLYHEQERAFARRTMRARNIIFYKKTPQDVIASILQQRSTSKTQRPVLVWSRSRKSHNRRMHALNGNTAASSSMMVDLVVGMTPPEVFMSSSITIDVPPANHPPQLTSQGPSMVDVPSDGLCLYHCLHAAVDVQRWLRAHAANGNALNPDIAAKDRAVAGSWKKRLIEVYVTSGRDAEAERLNIEGVKGYPGMDNLDDLSHLLGYTVVLLQGSLQIRYGTGPLGIALEWTKSTDGAGHQSDHFRLRQSWLRTPEASAAPAVTGEHVVLDGASSAAVLQPVPSMEMVDDANHSLEALEHRLAIPGANTSNDDFERMFAEIETTAAMELDSLIQDPVVDDNGVMAETARMLSSIRTKKPSWPSELQMSHSE